MPMIRVAQAQINPIVGDFLTNAGKILDFIDQAREKGADIITFPELCICGYPPEDLLLKPRFLQDNLNTLEDIIPHAKDITVVLGYAESSGVKLYNAAAILQNQRLVCTYNKAELPNYGVFDEKRYFEEGDRRLVFEMNQIRFTVTICEDIWIERGISEQFARISAADLVLNISASPFHAGKLDARLKIAARFAENTNTFLCFNNLLGGQDELVFDGGSFVMNPQGAIISRANRFREDLLITDIWIAHPKTGPGKVRHPGFTGSVISLDSRPSHLQNEIEFRMAEELGRLDEIYEALLLGTRDYIKKNGFEKVVLGLSGGIDSALTSVIAAGALGSENVVGVTMPSLYTSSETLADAERLAGNLKIRLITLPIDEVYGSYLKTLNDTLGSGGFTVAHENIQARIRGNILMALSNQFGWLVLTTGNKSETAVGYCTLYGDMAGGFAVIKDVPKTLVFELSEYVNTRWGKDKIPQSVLKRPPTAELRPDQKDEDTLPPYSVLDSILEAYVEEDRAPDEIIGGGFDSRTVNRVIRMVDLNEYKRRQAPVGLKITPKAFGRDRRLPITNLYSKSLS
jgi:NAD+ synthase (glutamine-hydrolysing)